MTISVYMHEKLPLTLVVYSDSIMMRDFEIFADFFRQPDIFSLKNAGIAFLERDTHFDELNFRKLMKFAKELEYQAQEHEKNGQLPPEMVPLIVSSMGQRLATRLWTSVMELAPKMRPKYKVCKSAEDAVSMLGIPSDIAPDIYSRRNFIQMEPPAHKELF